MGTLDRPKLRPVSVSRHDRDGQSFAAISDPSGVVEHAVLVPLDGFRLVVRHFDGKTSLAEIQARLRGETGGHVATADLERIVTDLDGAMILDGPTFQAYRRRLAREEVRPAALAGRSYPASADALRKQLEGYFGHEDGVGRPPGRSPASGHGRLRGVLAPHIDFARGGPVYSWAYQELLARSDAEVFVVIGVAHQYCSKRFALTRQSFDTPLGLARTDRAYVDRIAEIAGEAFFDDELCHRREHSVEFQAVFLNYLFAGKREFTIVPILAGSFHDLMGAGVDPIEDAEVRRFVEALRAAERGSGKKVAYVGGIDLCHVGPEFGDPGPVDPATLAAVDRFDHAMIARAEADDPAGWFRTAAEVDNRWRVCGLSATYTMLHAMGPARGRLLKYGQAVDASRTCGVTFASLAFDGLDAGPPL